MGHPSRAASPYAARPLPGTTEPGHCFHARGSLDHKPRPAEPVPSMVAVAIVPRLKSLGQAAITLKRAKELALLSGLKLLGFRA